MYFHNKCIIWATLHELQTDLKKPTAKLTVNYEASMSATNRKTLSRPREATAAPGSLLSELRPEE